jgi:predicted N-formylglutamate amidohydrolase
MVINRPAPPASFRPPVLLTNARGSSPFLLVCDHASNCIPPAFGTLGLAPSQRLMHVAWDPGALSVAHLLSDLLDATLIATTVSRLVIDCNRTLSAPDLVPTRSEATEIPGNVGLSAEQKSDRVHRYYEPFHAAITQVLNQRAPQHPILVTVHSFTPSYHGVPRPWPIGLIPGRDQTFARAVFEALKTEDETLNVGWNQPYASIAGVTYTLEHHGDERGIPAVMLEIRHDEILTPDGVRLWGGRIGRALEAAKRAWTKASAEASARAAEMSLPPSY